MPIRFHLDEHISAGIAAGLRRRNIDVTTAADAGLIGATDVAHLEFAASWGRVVVTQDDDFLRLHAQGATKRASPTASSSPCLSAKCCVA